MSQPYSSRFKSNLHILRSGTWAQLDLEIQRIIYLGIFKVPEKAKKAGTEHRTAPSLLSNCELCYYYFVTMFASYFHSKLGNLMRWQIVLRCWTFTVFRPQIFLLPRRLLQKLCRHTHSHKDHFFKSIQIKTTIKILYLNIKKLSHWSRM